jgi:TPP-dependent 2-oxoacid decarboxylase
MSANISCAVARLNDQTTAADLIDHAIQQCYLLSRPVYITLPTDSVTKKVEGERLKTPLDLTFKPNDAEVEDYVVEVILKHLRAAKSPIILVDACAVRHRVCTSLMLPCVSQVNKFARLWRRLICSFAIRDCLLSLLQWVSFSYWRPATIFDQQSNLHPRQGRCR